MTAPAAPGDSRERGGNGGVLQAMLTTSPRQALHSAAAAGAHGAARTLASGPNWALPALPDLPPPSAVAAWQRAAAAAAAAPPPRRRPHRAKKELIPRKENPACARPRRVTRPPARAGAAADAMTAWMSLPQHFASPYPTKKERQELSRQCGITERQVAHWFGNARQRNWKVRG